MIELDHGAVHQFSPSCWQPLVQVIPVNEQPKLKVLIFKGKWEEEKFPESWNILVWHFQSKKWKFQMLKLLFISNIQILYYIWMLLRDKKVKF